MPEGTGTFVFLGFTHFWGRGRKRGSWVVKRKTAASRLTSDIEDLAHLLRERSASPGVAAPAR